MTVFPTSATEPLVGLVMPVSVSESPSTSESSSSNRIPLRAVLSFVDSVSLTTVGASLAAATVMVSVPVFVVVPSDTV